VIAELLQFLKLFPGTFDALDIYIYFFSFTLAFDNSLSYLTIKQTTK
jgi:hypothetical protein